MGMHLQQSSSRRFPRGHFPNPHHRFTCGNKVSVKRCRPQINYAKAGGDSDMRTHKIAAMGGDGIGPEVVQAGVQVLKVCAERDGRFTLDFQDFDWGSDYYRTHGVMMPADGADQLRKFDAILFGAVGSPDIPDHITLWGLRLAICQPLGSRARSPSPAPAGDMAQRAGDAGQDPVRHTLAY